MSWVLNVEDVLLEEVISEPALDRNVRFLWIRLSKRLYSVCWIIGEESNSSGQVKVWYGHHIHCECRKYNIAVW